MPWQDKVEEWCNDPVTKQFFAEIRLDIGGLTERMLADETPYEDVLKIRGMVAALRGVLDMPKDGISKPE